MNKNSAREDSISTDQLSSWDIDGKEGHIGC